MTVALSVYFQRHPYYVELPQQALVLDFARKITEITQLDPENYIILVDHVPNALQLSRSIAHYYLTPASKILVLGQQRAIADPKYQLSSFYLEKVKRQAHRNNPVGMQNDGNLCYLASAVQFLSCVTPFSAGISELREGGNYVFQTFTRAMKALNYRDAAQPTRALGDALRAQYKQFELGRQSDAQEALECIEAEFFKDCGSGNASQGYSFYLNQFVKQHGLKELFSVHFTDGTDDTFLRLPVKAVETLEESVGVLLDKRKFAKLPALLQIHMLRFTQQGENLQKLTRKVALASEMTLYEFAGPECVVRGLEEGESQPIYHLKAIIAHKGMTVSQGHYVCYAKYGKQWYLFDDATVQAVDEITVLGCAGSSGMGFTSYVVLYCLEYMMQ